MQASGPSTAAQLSLFAKNFFKHPKMLGSIIPSSRFLIRALLKPVDWNRARVFVEYGPGVGTISLPILKKLRPDGKLILIETNPDFVDFLNRTVTDKRVHVFHRSAAEVNEILAEVGESGADYIVSGIPFSTMPGDVREAILKATNAALTEHGAFLVYQFSPKVHEGLKRFFGRTDRDFEAINVPPAHLYFSRKKAA